MNHRLDIINKPLMLYLSRLIDILLDFNWVLIDFRSQLSSHFDLLMSLSDVILEDEEHGLV